MRIDIYRPELEAIITKYLETGAYENAEDVIWRALRDRTPHETPAAQSNRKSLTELFEPIRGLLTDEEIDTLFRRNPSTGRPVALE